MPAVRRPLRALVAAVAVASTMAVAAPAMACTNANMLPPAPSAPGGPSNADLQSELKLRDAMLCLINTQRAKAGAPAVKIDSYLHLTSWSHATSSVVYMHMSDATGHPDYKGRVFGERISAYTGSAAENQLTRKVVTNATPQAAMNDFMASTLGHKEAILNPKWRYVGIGVALGAAHDQTRGATYVQQFGTVAGPGFRF